MSQTNPKVAKLETLLKSMQYGSKNDVKKVCEDIFKQFDTFDCHDIPNPGKQNARVIELIGTIPIPFKGVYYQLLCSLIFPPLYPNVPPLVHLINPDVKRFMALDKYDLNKLLFTNGRTYYPLSLMEVQSWISHKTVMRIIKEMTQLFAAEYPLYEINTKPTLLIDKPNTNYQTTYKVNPSTQFISKDQLITDSKKKYYDQAMILAKKLEKDLNEERQNIVQLQNLILHISAEEMRLQDFEDSAPAIIGDLEGKIEAIDQLLISKQGSALNLSTLKSAIFEADDSSKYIMDLVSSNKAIEELNIFSEELFKAGKVDLETYLKMYRENAEREFNNNIWMKKIVTGSCTF